MSDYHFSEAAGPPVAAAIEALLVRVETAEAAARSERARADEYQTTTRDTVQELYATIDRAVAAERERDEALAALARVQALCEDENGYTTWDQIEKLGEPPWRGIDPNLCAWEIAHGHDVRLDCGDGCNLMIDPEDVRAAITTPTASPATEGDTK